MSEKKGKTTEFFMLAVLVGAIALLSMVIIGFATTGSASKPNYYGAQYTAALKAEDPNDECKTPEGYTDAQWREHWGHHPDRYAKCLNK